MTTPSIQSLVDQLRRDLRPRRFLHIMGVMHTACALARAHGIDVADAALAALFHDASKEIAPEAIREDLHRRGRAIAADDEAHPKIWHGPHAAVALVQDYDWNNKDRAGAIARAVECHSTGAPQMEPLSAIVFLADALEPGRDYEHIDRLRAVAREDLDRGVADTLKVKCGALAARGAQPHARATRALEYYA